MLELQGSGQTSHSGSSSFAWHDFCCLLDSVSSDKVSWTPPVPLPVWLWQPGQYFFEHHPQKRAVEIVCLKLSLLRDLCVLVADDHERHACARGVISPEHIVVQVPEQRASVLPIRWNARVTVADVGRDEGSSFEKMPEEMARRVSTIAVNDEMVYAAPSLREWPPGKTLTVTALVQSADHVPEEDPATVRGLVRVHVIAEGLQARDFSDLDVFRVTLPLGQDGGSSVKLWARKVSVPERGIVVSGMTDAMPLHSWNLFVQALGDVRAAAEMAVYRAGSPGHDVYSCGMLLLRALLGSEEERWRRACEQMPVIVRGLKPIVQGLAEDDHYTVFLRVRERLRESDDCFERTMVPDGIWWDALVTVLRACSRIPGFSYASEKESFKPSPLRFFARDLSSLARRARVELFEADERDAVIARACDRVSDRLRTGMC